MTAFARFWKTAGLMLLLAVVLGWFSVFLIPVAIRLGLAAPIADKIPFVGFFTGLVWGLGIGISRDMKETFLHLAGALLFGAVCWFFAVLIGGLLVGFGVSPAFADLVPTFGFCLGLVVGAIPLVFRGVELLDAFRARLGIKRRN